MTILDEIRKTRLKKLKEIQKAGFLTYPSETKRTHKIEEALKNFTNFARLKKEIILAGRIKSQRGHGGSTFLDVEDGTGKIQAYLKKF